MRKLTGELTADQSVLIESARESEVVVFDEANGKIKRKHALPINPREALYFTAVIENLPADATVEAVETLCTEAGFKPDKVLIAINPRAKIDVTGRWDVRCPSRPPSVSDRPVWLLLPTDPPPVARDHRRCCCSLAPSQRRVRVLH